MRRLILLSLVLPLFGYTNCQYFSDVTVPATDTQPPLAISSIVVDGVQQNSFTPIQEVYHDLRFVIAMASIFDQGGARAMEMLQSAQVSCGRGSLGQTVFVDMAPLRDEQTGTVGSTVKNGIYLFTPVDLAAYARLCGSGFTVREIRYGWSIRGTDFIGNTVSAPGGSIVYRP